MAKEKVETAALKFKIKRQITVPLMKLNPGEPVYVVFTGEEPRHVQIDNKPGADGKLKNPATTLRATDLNTGELVDIIASTVLLSQLDREYGGVRDELAGKALMIESTGKRAGKEYNDIRLSELEV